MVLEADAAQSRNLRMDLDDGGRRVQSLLRDRDAMFTTAFRRGVHRHQCPHFSGCRCVHHGPTRSGERFVGTIRRELLDRILIMNPYRPAEAIALAYEHHYNDHRPHRALGQAAPLTTTPPARDA